MHPTQSESPLIVYMDYKSPYAYLAKDPVSQLAQAIGIHIDWRPLTLDIPSYLGSARTNKTGKVVESKRSPRQWAMVRYAYRDAKRYARLRNITLLGTQKIWDSSLASIGMLWCKTQGYDILGRYHDITYERFWKRELDIEDLAVVTAVLKEAGAETDGFAEYAAGTGRQQHDTLQALLHPAGIFGVPTFIVRTASGSEMLFGRENLPRVRWLLDGAQGVSPDIAYQ